MIRVGRVTPLLASSSILCVTPRRNLTISTWLLRGACNDIMAVNFKEESIETGSPEVYLGWCRQSFDRRREASGAEHSKVLARKPL